MTNYIVPLAPYFYSETAAIHPFTGPPAVPPPTVARHLTTFEVSTVRFLLRHLGLDADQAGWRRITHEFDFVARETVYILDRGQAGERKLLTSRLTVRDVKRNGGSKLMYCAVVSQLEVEPIPPAVRFSTTPHPSDFGVVDADWREAFVATKNVLAGEGVSLDVALVERDRVRLTLGLGHLHRSSPRTQQLVRQIKQQLETVHRRVHVHLLPTHHGIA